MAIILTKKSDTASSVPLVADLTNAAGGAELAVNTADKRLFTKTSGGTVVELGTNPSALTLPNGTANGIPYLNGSKVLTSGSALTFDGAKLVNTSGVAGALIQSTDTGGTGSFLRMLGDATSGNLINWATGTALRFATSDSAFGSFTEQMRLTSTGLGIGTSSPTSKLTIGSGSFASASAQTTGMYTNGANGLVILTDALGINTRTGGQLLTLDSSGNLGLGVTPSASTLPTIQSAYGLITGNNEAHFSKNAYYNAGWKYSITAPAARYSVGEGDSGFRWYTAPSGTAGNAITFTQAMTLDASGNFLVGTTSASSLSGNCFNYNPNTSNSAYGHASGISSGTNYIGFLYAGGTIGSITQNGTTAVAYNTTSDHRLKNNVRTADALRFKDIRFVDFEWVDGRHDCGVIAHELQAIYPDLVVGNKDETEVRTVELTPAVPAVLDEEGNVITPEVPAVTEEQTFDKHQQVNYIGLIPRMGTVIQQLMAKVEAMEAEIAALKAAP